MRTASHRGISERHVYLVAPLVGLLLLASVAGSIGPGVALAASHASNTKSVDGVPVTGLLATIEKQGYIVMGNTELNPPESYLNTTTARWLGIDADVSRQIAKSLGVGLRGVPLTGAAQVPAVQSGRVDAMIGLFYTSVRAQVVDYNKVPYWYVGDMVVTQKTNTGLTKLSNLRGLTIGVVRGSAQEIEATAFVKDFGVKSVVEYPDSQSMLSDVADGRLESAIWWGFEFQWALKQNPSLNLRRAFVIPPGYLGEKKLNPTYIVFPKSPSSDNLSKVVDNIITKMRADGELKTIFAKFGLKDSSYLTGLASKSS
jgi:polar amino acid transport system substrate-binding protein